MKSPSRFSVRFPAEQVAGTNEGTSAFSDVWGWWRADTISGTSGSYSLADRSRNGRAMTQSAGTLTVGTAANGKAMLTGNATARLDCAATLRSWPHTIVTIGKRADGNPAGFFGHQGTTPYNTLWSGFESLNRYAIYGVNSALNTQAGGADGCWVTRHGHGTRVALFDGIIQADQTAASIVRSSAAAVSLGTQYRGLNLDWYETLVWDRTLSLAELDQVHRYVNARYGMTIPMWSSYSNAAAFWLGGQSNAAGRGDRGTSDANIPSPYKDVQTGKNIWYGTPSGSVGNAFSTLSIAANNHMLGDVLAATYIGPECTMLYDWAARTQQTPYLMKCAVGSSWLAYQSAASPWWHPTQGSDANTQANTQNYFNLSMRNWWLSLRAHQQASRKPVVKACVFYQGEQDATQQAAAQAWSANFQSFARELRAEMGCGNAPMFVCRIHANDDITDQPYRDTVRAQQAAAVLAVPNATLISVDAYGLRDITHINVAGQLALGTQLANAIGA